MSNLTIELLIGSMLCLLHLGIGLAIGWRFGRFSAPGVHIAWPVPPPVEQSESQRLMAAWDDLRQRLIELASNARETQQVPQEVLSQWRTELAHLTNELHQVLDRKLGITEAPRPPDADTSVMLASNGNPVDEAEPGIDIITNAQIVELVSGVGNESHECVPLVRYRFPVKQPLAGRLNNGAVKAFGMVQCHDLSVTNVRYFVDDLPTEEFVVIGLGLPKPVKWLAAEVENFRSAFMYGRVGYLVTARLRASIDKRLPELVGSNGG